MPVRLFLIPLPFHFVLVTIIVMTTSLHSDSFPRLIMLNAKRLEDFKSSFYELNCSSSTQSIENGAEFLVDRQTVEHISFYDNICYNIKKEECTTDRCQCFHKDNNYIYYYENKEQTAELIIGCQMRFIDNETSNIIKLITSVRINGSVMDLHEYTAKILKKDKEIDTGNTDEKENNSTFQISLWVPIICGVLIVLSVVLIFSYRVQRRRNRKRTAAAVEKLSIARKCVAHMGKEYMEDKHQLAVEVVKKVKEDPSRKLEENIARRQFDIVECTDCSITMAWYTNDQDNCLSYEIDYRLQRTKDWYTCEFLSQEVFEKEDGRRMYTLQNLQPATYYEFKLRSVYKDAKGHYSESKTKQTLKLAPRQFDIVECTDCSITMAWYTNDQDDCLTYEIDHRLQRTKDWYTWTFLSKSVLEEEDGRRMYTLQNLQPETYYEFKLRSVYKDAKSHYSESKSKQTLKLAPRLFDIVECTDCSITVEWFIDIEDEYSMYELEYRSQNTQILSVLAFSSTDVVEKEDGRRMYTLQNLLPETWYTFKLRSVYKDAKSHFSEIKTTQTLKLAPRLFDIVECTDCSITVEWLIDVEDEYSSYELVYRSPDSEILSVLTFSSKDVVEMEDGRRLYTLQNLLPETCYEFKLRSVYNDTNSHFSESKTKQTLKLGSEKI